MVLISLLLVICLERAMRKQPAWHIETHLKGYFSWAEGQRWLAKQSQQFQRVLTIGMPVIATYVVTQWLFSGLISFVLQTAVLFLCIGSEPLRATYRNFLQAAERKDAEACFLYTQQLGHCTHLDVAQDITDQGKSFGQHLMWLNFQHYGAVIIFYTVFGASGALLYVISRESYLFCCEQHEERRKTVLAKWMHILEYIPVRIAAFGLLLVGHFSRALPTWLRYLTHPSVCAETVLTEVAANAEDVILTSEQNANPACEPKALVTLAKRNVMLMLAIVAVLTLLGFVD